MPEPGLGSTFIDLLRDWMLWADWFAIRQWFQSSGMERRRSAA